ncbi:MAG: hypothetical protein DRN81_04785 [Thermoproteota archaeon]|nr:MAG: hypothetical protein DRN81_04785 [Candidatus Korarchaeota archaeon]
MAFWQKIGNFLGKRSKDEGLHQKEQKIEKWEFEKFISKLAVPWEKDISPEKRRYYVHAIKRGGMGIVYLVLDKEEGVFFAIKTFQDKYLKSTKSIEQFKKEAEVWVELGKHKNIVKAFFVETHYGRPYIFMEWVVGDEQYGADLSGWIYYKALDLPLMVNFAIQFCRGMTHAEERFKEIGRVFVHRDIKPSNIMVTRDKVIKVTDFGLVQTIREENFESEFIGDKDSKKFTVLSKGGIYGTPFYMSPEQILQGVDELKYYGVLEKTIEPPPLDIRSDIYSFGCVLYAMVKGEPPFFEYPLSVMRYFYQTLYEEPEPVKSGDKKFDELIMKCLRKKPEQRFKNFSELEEVLQTIYEHLTGKRLKKETSKEFEAWELVNRGFSFCNLGQYEKAINDFNKAIEIDPSDAVAYTNRGTAYDNLGQYDKAIDDYNKAIEINSRYAEAYNNRGNVYHKLGQYNKAIQDYNKAIEINPNYAKAYNNRGTAYADLNQYQQAMENYNKAIKLNPNYAEAYYNRGITYHYDLGQYDKALKDYNKAIEINPDFVNAYYNRGNIYYDLGQYDRAINDYSKVIELNLHLAINLNLAIVYIKRGIAYYNSGQYDKAISDFRRFCELAPPQYAERVTEIKELIRQLEQQM